MAGNVFSPGTAGAGSHTITYDYTDILTTCSGSHSAQVSISALPTVANAGTDTSAIFTTIQLSANTPLVGTGFSEPFFPEPEERLAVRIIQQLILPV